MSEFVERMARGWETSGAMLCVGLDPDADRFPADWRGDPFRIFEFCRDIVDATADLACAFKPQIAYFAAVGAEDQLVKVCRYVRAAAPHALLILDAKRGDIGPTAERYAREAFERYDADAVTVNPYLGVDSLRPFLDWTDRGIFVLCRTSNPGGADLQGLVAGDEPVFARVAEMVATRCNEHDQCGLVVGATYPEELALVRALAPRMPLLVPGVGAQGGDAAQVMEAGRDAQGRGLVVNSSRAILYASDGPDFAEAARRVAELTAAELRITRVR